MKTGLIVAMKEEVPTNIGRDYFKEGEIYQITPDLTLAITGFGKENAQFYTERLCNMQELDELVCLGFCGSVDNLTIGDVISVEATKYKGAIIYLQNQNKFMNFRRGNMETFEEAGTSRNNISEGILAVDMESYFIAEIAEKYNLPLTIAKAVTDVIPFEPVKNPRERFLQEFYRNLPVAKSSINKIFEELRK